MKETLISASLTSLFSKSPSEKVESLVKDLWSSRFVGWSFEEAEGSSRGIIILGNENSTLSLIPWWVSSLFLFISNWLMIDQESMVQQRTTIEIFSGQVM